MFKDSSSYLRENTVCLHYKKSKLYKCCTGKQFLFVVKRIQNEYTLCGYSTVFLGAFAKLRKATVSFVMSVCMKQLGSHWKDFHEIWYLSIFRKSVKKIQFSLKSDKNNRYCTSRPIHIFLSFLSQFFSEWEWGILLDRVEQYPSSRTHSRLLCIWPPTTSNQSIAQHRL